MSILARFIGVDRYSSPEIRDLSGARRDAVAMHALFSDSLPNVKAELVTDEEATAARVRECLDQTLGEAGEGDTVILFFAGHGSSDHRLVCHDSAREDFVTTSLGMDEIARMFRSTRAKVALCLLDCCFSGGAPARVFAEVATPRGPGPSAADFTGQGRLLLTASADDEPAYEDPRSRHGLFTKALLAALQDAEADADLTALLTDVMSRVRADAAKLGVVQTPHLAGSVQGGLGLPRMRAGNAFRAAFPEIHGVRVERDMRELATLGIPAEVAAAWHERMPGGLNDLQMEAVNEKRVLDGRSLLVVAPTSAGKTLVGEMAAARAAADGRKTAFLLPYKALTNEKFDQFSALYGERLGMRVVRCTGDHSDQAGEVLKGKYDIALFTYEMFLNLAVSNPALLNQIGLIVVDEAQFVTDKRRGIAVELLLTMLLAARERGVEPQVVCLSAVIGDVNAFDAWLGLELLVTDWRPVRLVEGVLGRDGEFHHLDDMGNVAVEQLVPRGEIVQRRDKPSSQDVIVPLLKRLVASGEQVIVFRNQRGKAQGCANYLAQDLALPPAQSALDALPEGDPSSASRTLRRCLAGGTAFHTSDLTRDERAVVERAFRDPSGGVRVLGATTTVAAGINSPASTVILAENEFRGEDNTPFTIAEYKNMAGRAGRLGYNEEGKAILLAETPRERHDLFQRYVLGALEPLRSAFDPNHVDTWVLRLLAQVPSVPADAVPSLLARTYGGYLAALRDPSWASRAEGLVDGVVDRMLVLELAEVDGGMLSLTLLGRACGRSALSFASALRLVELVRSLGPATLTPERLMVLLQALPESDEAYTPLMRRGTSESVRPQQAAQRFGGEIVRLLQKRVDDQHQYYARCKRAAVLGAWIDGVAIEEIERRFTPNPFQGAIAGGHVRAFADLTRLYLRAAADIAVLVHVEAGIDAEQLDALLRRLEVGLPSEALALLDGSPFLDRGACMALIGAGINDMAAIAAMSTDHLRSVVGVILADRLRGVERVL